MNVRLDKLLWAAAAIAVALFFSYRFVDRQFRLDNVRATWSLEPSEQIDKKALQSLEKIFSQPFHYLDRGKQSYVFVSDDRRYVLKFFDTRCLRSGAIPFLFPIDQKRCAKKMERLVEGYRIAWTYDRDNAGIAFLQLAPNPSYTLVATVADRFGFDHEIDLAEVPFVLQKKAVPMREAITTLLNKGDVEGAKHLLQRMIEMYLQEYQRGLLDRDHNFMYNTGFLGETPIRIDVGRMQFDERFRDPAVYMKDLEKVFIERLGEWMERHFPQYRQEVLGGIEVYLHEIRECKANCVNSASMPLFFQPSFKQDSKLGQSLFPPVQLGCPFFAQPAYGQVE